MGRGGADPGVHARGQVAHFDAPTASALVPTEWKRALNANLPPSVRIVESVPVASDFHARYSASGKTYVYRILNGRVLPPHEFGLVWHVYQRIDCELLREALGTYLGTHDFRGFAANRRDASDQRSAVRTIRRADLAAENLPHFGSETVLFTIRFDGNGFLYHMVRLLVGSAVRVATNREDLQWLTEIRDRVHATKSAHCARQPASLCTRLPTGNLPTPNAISTPM